MLLSYKDTTKHVKYFFKLWLLFLSPFFIKASAIFISMIHNLNALGWLTKLRWIVFRIQGKNEWIVFSIFNVMIAESTLQIPA